MFLTDLEKCWRKPLGFRDERGAVCYVDIVLWYYGAKALAPSMRDMVAICRALLMQCYGDVALWCYGAGT